MIQKTLFDAPAKLEIDAPFVVPIGQPGPCVSQQPLGDLEFGWRTRRIGDPVLATPLLQCLDLVVRRTRRK